MKKFIYPLLALILLACDDEDVYTYDKGLYTIDWQVAADSSTVSLIERFWNESEGRFNYENDGLNTEWHYWPQAHAMDVLIDAYQRTNDQKYVSYFDKWYIGIKAKNGNTYYNNFYDDMEWIALTMLKLYDITKDERYLTTAKELWIDIQGGWNEHGEGGIAWAKDRLMSKNACSNGPASIIASRMYAITKSETDLKWAKDIYAWGKKILVIEATGAVCDNYNAESKTLSQVYLSYNQGTFVGAAYELYKITGENFYLNDARKMALFCITDPGMIDTSNNVLRDEGDGDNGLFKGIFMRYFVQLMQEPNLDEAYRNKFTTFFNNNANVLWRNGVYKEDFLFGQSWSTPAMGATQLTSHVSGCLLMEAKALFDTTNK